MKFYKSCLNWIKFEESSEVEVKLNDQLYFFSQNFKKQDMEEMFYLSKKQQFIAFFRLCTLFQIVMNLIISLNTFYFYQEIQTSLFRLTFALWLMCTLVLQQNQIKYNWVNLINLILVMNSFIHVAIHMDFLVKATAQFTNFSQVNSQLLTDGFVQTFFAISYLQTCPSWQCQILILSGYFIPSLALSKDYLNYGQFYEYLLMIFVCFLIRMKDKSTKIMYLQVNIQKQNNMACQRIFDECVPQSIIIVKTSVSNCSSNSPKITSPKIITPKIVSPNLSVRNNFLVDDSEAVQTQCQLLYANKFAQHYLDCCVGINCVEQMEAISVIQQDNQCLNLFDVLKSSSWDDIILKDDDCIQYALGQDQRILTCSRNYTNVLEINTQIKQYCDITLRSCMWEGQRSIIIVLNDTTDRVTRIEYFKDLNSYKDQLLATVSHDLKTPLNAIQLLLFSIKELCGNNKSLGVSEIKSILQYVNDIYQSNCMLMTMINDLLDYSQMRIGKLRLTAEQFSLEECLKTIYSIFNGQTQQKKLELIFERINCNESLNLKTDQNRLKQILINLLSNSLKFTFEGHIKLIIIHQEPYIEFIVEDTGIGMPQCVVEKLFKSYATFNIGNKNKQGVGLGLLISSKLVGLLGPTETIKVESEEGKGTKFTFKIYKKLNQRNGSSYLEFKSETEIAQQPKMSQVRLKFISSQIRFTRSYYQVMIVDDTIFNITAFKIILQKVMNCHVTDAYNGLDAVKSVQQGQKYDLIFMDISMPVMDGYQATELIRKYEVEQDNKPSIIIMASAYTLEQEYSNIQKYGADGLIEKPIVIKRLAEILKKYKFIE